MDLQRDYYADLDIMHSESLEGIQKAYRRLAKVWHPDHAGAGGEERFRAIQEAYQVLSDPQQRHQYDKAAHWGRTKNGTTPEPLVRTGAHRQPLEPFTGPLHRTFQRPDEILMGAFRREICEFTRIAELVLSPAILSPELTDNEVDCI